MKEAPPRGVRFSILHRAMKKLIDDYMSSEGLSEEERAQLISITDVMVNNALKYIGKGCECESDKEACAESAGI